MTITVDPIERHAANECKRLGIPGQWALWPAEQGQKLQPVRDPCLGSFLDNHSELKEHIDWDPEVARKHQEEEPQYFLDPSNCLHFHHLAPDGKQIVGAMPYRAEAVTECLEFLKGTGFWDKPAPENPAPPQLAATPGDRPSPDETRGVHLLIQHAHLIEIAS